MPSPAILLLISVLLPLMGAALIAALAPRGRAAVRQSALVTSLVTLAIVVVLVAQFPGGNGAYAAVRVPWLEPASGLHVSFTLALDGLSLWFFALSALLVVSSVLVSWQAIGDRPAAFYALLLLLESGMLGLFAARDILLFYIFFEFTLIPLFFLIGIWGSDNRRHAAVKFFLFTFAGSVLTFLGLLTLVIWQSWQRGGPLEFSMPGLAATLAADPLPVRLQVWVFLALFAGFAIKVPLVPLHTWLPLAHVEAPTAGSVLLAGILLKVGTYGFLRFSLPLLPDASALFAPLLLWLAVAGIVYGALVALAQSDIKRMIAYSSVSHLGFCMLGLFAFNRLGMQGGTLQMINHGLSTGGLFACVGMLYERYHTREIRRLGGLARSMPVLAFFFVLFTLSSIGLPGLNGFVGEFLLLLGMFQRSMTGAPVGLVLQYRIIAVLALSGVVLGAWYMLWLVEQTLFGPPAAESPPASASHTPRARASAAASDLCLREVLALAPLAALVVWIGIQPRFFLDRISPALDPITQTVEARYEQQFELTELAGHLARASEEPKDQPASSQGAAAP